MLMNILWILLGVIALLWLVARFHLGGQDLSVYDAPTGQRFAPGRPAHPGVAASMARLNNYPEAKVKGLPRRQLLAARRRHFDHMFDDHVFDASFTRIDLDGTHGEWVMAPGADPSRRMLYLHGGGFMLGSARSHRPITSRMSALTGGAVLAIDYRLMPEHKRREGIEDCRHAYRWMLEHGPSEASPAQAVFVAGDSAGANLTLCLLAWARDQGLRAANAAVVLAPPTDSTFSSPSIRSNRASDLMLGPALGFIASVPRSLLLWLSWLHSGIRPNDPIASPIHGDLSRLPPTLVHVSETEMLLDDARRYVNRAQAAGSSAQLQTWDNTLHVWHIFDPELPEAGEAYAEIGKFLDGVAPRPAP